MVLLEVWESQKVLDQHHEQVYLKATHKALEKEDLCVKDELIMVCDEVWGFEGRDGKREIDE